MGIYIYIVGVYKEIIVILSVCAKTSKRSRDNQNLPLVTKTLEIKQGFPSDLGIHYVNKHLADYISEGFSPLQMLLLFLLLLHLQYVCKH